MCKTFFVTFNCGFHFSRRLVCCPASASNDGPCDIPIIDAEEINSGSTCPDLWCAAGTKRMAAIKEISAWNRHRHGRDIDRSAGGVAAAEDLGRRGNALLRAAQDAERFLVHSEKHALAIAGGDDEHWDGDWEPDDDEDGKCDLDDEEYAYEYKDLDEVELRDLREDLGVASEDYEEGKRQAKDGDVAGVEDQDGNKGKAKCAHICEDEEMDEDVAAGEYQNGELGKKTNGDMDMDQDEVKTRDQDDARGEDAKDDEDDEEDDEDFDPDSDSDSHDDKDDDGDEDMDRDEDDDTDGDTENNGEDNKLDKTELFDLFVDLAEVEGFYLKWGYGRPYNKIHVYKGQHKNLEDADDGTSEDYTDDDEDPGSDEDDDDETSEDDTDDDEDPGSDEDFDPESGSDRTDSESDWESEEGVPETFDYAYPYCACSCSCSNASAPGGLRCRRCAVSDDEPCASSPCAAVEAWAAAADDSRVSSPCAAFEAWAAAPPAPPPSPAAPPLNLSLKRSRGDDDDDDDLAVAESTRKGRKLAKTVRHQDINRLTSDVRYLSVADNQKTAS